MPARLATLEQVPKRPCALGSFGPATRCVDAAEPSLSFVVTVLCRLATALSVGHPVRARRCPCRGEVAVGHNGTLASKLV